MACNTKNGPAALISYVEDHCGVKITQSDWHALRMLAQKEEGGSGSRTRATDAEIESAVESLSSAVASESNAAQDDNGYASEVDSFLNLSDEEYDELNPNAQEFVDETQRLEKTLLKSQVTVGSLEAIGYISAWGAEEALKRAREEQVNRKKAGSTDSPEIDLDRQNALDALDRKVARERKRMGLPPLSQTA